MNSSIPNTYYVLDNISTCPILVPLRDYCRKKDPNNVEKVAKDIQDNWNSIIQINGKDNEKIKIFHDNSWK